MKRFLSSLLFSSAFIWVAVVFFDVETEVVYVLFIFSLMLVAAAIITGLFFSPILRKILRRPGSSLLSQVRAGTVNLNDAGAEAPVEPVPEENASQNASQNAAQNAAQNASQNASP